MEGYVKLRTLTRKSVLWFGKHEDRSVQQIIDLGRLAGVSYLAWLYYNNDKISFNDELLEELFIVGDLILNKPTKNPLMYKRWKKENLNDQDYLDLYRDKKRESKFNRYSSNRNDSKNFSAQNIMNKNHGK